MSEMLDKVARALEQAENKFWAQFPAGYGMTDERVPFDVLARAAVLAMREPDKAMVATGVKAWDDWNHVTEVWHEMIDEALKP